MFRVIRSRLRSDTTVRVPCPETIDGLNETHNFDSSGLKHKTDCGDVSTIDKDKGCNPQNTPKHGSDDAQFGFLEVLLYMDYFLALVPFRVAPDGGISRSWLNKVVFITINILALTHIYVQVRNLDSRESKQKILLYISMGYQISIALMQIRSIQLVFTKQSNFQKLFRLLRSSTFSSQLHSRMTKYGAASIRVSSYIVAIVCSLGGLNVILGEENWSVAEVLIAHQYSVEKAMMTLPENGSVSASPGGSFASWQNGEGGPPVEDPNLERNVLGYVGVALNFLCQLANSCPLDLLLLSTLTLWMCAIQLKNKLEQLQNQKDRGEVGKEKQLFCELMGDHKQLMEISREINEILKVVMPTVIMTCVIMSSYFIHVMLTRHSYFRTVYYSLKLSKVAFTFLLAKRISDHMDGYTDWFISEDTQQVLDIEPRALQIKFAEVSTKPVGIGINFFYVDQAFISSFIGIALSYFFIVADALEEKVCTCKW